MQCGAGFVEYRSRISPFPTMTPRRFSPPWSVEELEACFIVLDANGQKLGYFYYEEEPGRRSAAKLLTKDEARRSLAPPVAQRLLNPKAISVAAAYGRP
jgi:hypothetical protein